MDIDQRLERCLPGQAPQGLRDAMAYALLGAGKRLRPLMVLGAASCVGGAAPPTAAWHGAVAIECVHAYSLVHDDLPAMDDDDTRRGRPTVHRAYDQATAILVGDALQALAFACLAEAADAGQASLRLRLVAELADGAGAVGMVGGQHLDLRLGRDATEAAVIDLHRRKTGALFRAAARMGAIAAGAEADSLAALGRFGDAFGALYQAVDDALDAGEDDGPSLARHWGAEGLRRHGERQVDACNDALAAFGSGGEPLRALVAQAAALAGWSRPD